MGLIYGGVPKFAENGFLGATGLFKALNVHQLSPSIKLNKSSAFTSFDSFGIILTDTKFILNFKNIYQIFYSDNVITMH